MRHKNFYIIFAIILVMSLTGCAKTYSININYNVDAGTVEGDGEYQDEEDVVLVAESNSGYEFLGWYEEDKKISSLQKLKFSAKEDRNINAKFGEKTYRVEIKLNYPSMGTVSGSGQYNHGEVAKFKAKSNEGFTFNSWENAPNNVDVKSSEVQFEIVEDKEIVANFSIEENYWSNLFLKDKVEGIILPVYKNEQIGYINTDGQQVIEYNEHQLVKTNIPNKVLFDHSIERTRFIDDLEVFPNHPIIFSYDDLVIFFNNNGELLFISPSSAVKTRGRDSYYNQHGLVSYKNKRYGFINYVGEEILNHKYDDIYTLNDSLLILSKDGKYGVFDVKSKEVLLDFVYEKIEWYSQIDRILLGKKEDSKHLYNSKGEEVSDITNINIGKYRTGGITSYREDGRYGFGVYGLLNYISGEILTDPIFDDIGNIQEECVYVKQNELWGLVDTFGNVLLPPQFDLLRGHHELIYFELGSEVGYLDKSGDVLVKGEFDSITPFGNHWVAEKKDTYYLLKDGEIVEEFDGYASIEQPPAHIGKYIAYREYPLLKKGDYKAVFDIENGRYLTKYIYRTKCCEGYTVEVDGILQLKAKIEDDNSQSLINVRTGEVIVESGKYDDFGYLIDGRVKVIKDNKYGYVDKEGEIVINTIFDDATTFNNGVAGVREGNKVAYIDKDGDYVIDSVKLFDDETENNDIFLDLFYYPDEKVFSGSGNLYFKKDGSIIHDLDLGKYR